MKPFISSRARSLENLQKHVTISVLLLSFFSSTPSRVTGQGFESMTPLTPLVAVKNTGEKPQSKVWTYDNQWWTVFPVASGTYVWRLDGTEWTSVLKISPNTTVKADCKVVNNVCHILLWRKEDNPSQLVSIEYVPGSTTYMLWTKRIESVYISLDPGVETGTIDIDSKGRMWLASDGVDNIYVRWSNYPYKVWSAPITVATGVSDEDIGMITSLPVQRKVGVMWSNQNTKRFGFRTHADDDHPSIWSADEVPASQSATNKRHGMAANHLNVAIGSDGTMYCAVKTSYDTIGYPRVALLKRNPGGNWDDLYPISETGTRPIVILNEAIGKLKVVYVSSTLGGDIVYTESNKDVISFGTSQVLISGKYNSPTSTKNNYNSSIVILASDSISNIVGVLAKDLTSSITAIEEDLSDASILYPNPVHDMLFLQSQELSEKNTLISISNVEGKVVYKSQAFMEGGKLEMNLGGLNLSPGLYFIRFQSTTLSKAFRFIKI